MLQQLLLRFNERLGFVAGSFGFFFERLQSLFQFVGIFFLVELAGHGLQRAALFRRQCWFGLVAGRFATLARVSGDRAIFFDEVLIDDAFDVRGANGLMFAAGFIDFAPI